jgi:protein O-mannose beta-1,4-N-acetylglucosaminyltransferase
VVGGRWSAVGGRRSVVGGARYVSWSNTIEANSVPHPERGADGGGIAHLAASLQAKIRRVKTVPLHRCCTDPYWLYRIYQDTVVEIDEVCAS